MKKKLKKKEKTSYPVVSIIYPKNKDGKQFKFQAKVLDVGIFNDFIDFYNEEGWLVSRPSGKGTLTVRFERCEERVYSR